MENNAVFDTKFIVYLGSSVKFQFSNDTAWSIFIIFMNCTRMVFIWHFSRNCQYMNSFEINLKVKQLKIHELWIYTSIISPQKTFTTIIFNTKKVLKWHNREFPVLFCKSLAYYRDRVKKFKYASIYLPCLNSNNFSCDYFDGCLFFTAIVVNKCRKKSDCDF